MTRTKGPGDKPSKTPSNSKQAKPKQNPKQNASKPQAKPDQEPKRGRGRPAYEPNDIHRAQIKALRETGHTKDEVARYLGISEETLCKYYGDVLETAHIDVVKRVGERLIKAALEGNLTAAMFFLKTRGGWRETGPVVPIDPTADGLDDFDPVTGLADSELIRISMKEDDDRKAASGDA